MSAPSQGALEDGETFGWPTVRAYHAVWLQHIEQGRATWDDETTRLKLRRYLVWHRMAPSSQPSSTPASTPQAPTRAPRCTANPGDRACVAFNQGMCTSNVAHPADLHVCSYCLKTACRLWNHSVTCNHKLITKNGHGGPPAIDRHPSLGQPPLKRLSDPLPGNEGTGCSLHTSTLWISTYSHHLLPNTATLQYRQRQKHRLW